MTLTFIDKGNETELKIECRAVPESEEDRTREGWQRYYCQAIKQTFGFGARLCWVPTSTITILADFFPPPFPVYKWAPGMWLYWKTDLLHHVLLFCFWFMFKKSKHQKRNWIDAMIDMTVGELSHSFYASSAYVCKKCFYCSAVRSTFGTVTWPCLDRSRLDWCFLWIECLTYGSMAKTCLSSRTEKSRINFQTTKLICFLIGYDNILDVHFYKCSSTYQKRTQAWPRHCLVYSADYIYIRICV